ncbi:MAG: transglycosylase domain-containing protein [Alphaproteobacteria bacterium]
MVKRAEKTSKTKANKTVSGRKAAPKRASSKAGPKKASRKTSLKTQSMSLKRRLFRLFLKLCLAGLVLGAVAFIGLILFLGPTLPNVNEAFSPRRAAVITIVDANGSSIYRQGSNWGEPLTVADLPTSMPDALTAVEDKRFYWHFGIDPYSISRAVYRNIRHGRREGGSTLTQQLAKNMFLTANQTLKRKAQEALLSLWLEWKFTKEQILTIYLNRVYFGTNAWTVDGASQAYFGHSARTLSIWESAMLAGIMKNPNGNNPHSNLKRANARTKLVLKLMLNQKKITKQEYEAALAEGANKSYPKKTHQRSWFIDWVLAQSQSFIQSADADITIETTYDPVAQKIAEDTLNKYLDGEGKSKNVSQGALLSMTADGAVVAMVGGRDYAKSQFNRAAQAKRQPGSSFKPLVWQVALDQGMTLNDKVMDAPVDIDGWKPQNYSRKYSGEITLQQALRSSINTIAAQLAVMVGPQKIVDAAYKQGVLTQLEPNYSIALGTEEVTLQDMVSLYGSWASGGYQIFPWGIKRIVNSYDVVLYEHDGQKFAQSVSTPVVAQMNLALSDVIKNGTGKNAKLPFDVAGKTGTTQSYRDAWFLGYSSYFVTGVWLGNDDNSKMKNVTGGSMPAKIWHDYMQAVHQDLPPVDLPKPLDTYILDENDPTRDLILW